MDFRHHLLFLPQRFPHLYTWWPFKPTQIFCWFLLFAFYTFRQARFSWNCKSWAKLYWFVAFVGTSWSFSRIPYRLLILFSWKPFANLSFQLSQYSLGIDLTVTRNSKVVFSNSERKDLTVIGFLDFFCFYWTVPGGYY